MRTRAGWVVLAILLGGCKGLKENYDKEFKVSFGKEFTTSCTKGATAQGAPEARAAAVCGCMAKYLVEHRSTTELTKLSLSATTPESQTVIREAATACKPSADRPSVK
jgi:hypothetical protein